MTRKTTSHETHDGQVLRVVLDAPPGNVLDRELMDEVTAALVRARSRDDLKAVVFEGRGDHFSYGASIPEHRKEEVAEMLDAFSRLFRALIDTSLPALALVRGRCLGGGLELASFCHWTFAQEEATLGQPEIRLGVFPPFAALILPAKIGQAHADDVILSGRTLSAPEALEMGLVHAVDRDAGAALEKFLSRSILPRSAVALRHTVRAARAAFHGAFLERLDAMHRHYLDELMQTDDANEGIEAFLAKRDPVWRNR